MPHWLVMDLEATTDDGGWPIEEMEVIEIGASVVTRRKGETLSRRYRSNGYTPKTTR